MSATKNIKKLAYNPYKLFSLLATKGKMNWVPDYIYLKLMYRARFGRKLNLNNPITFNEKMQYLKLFDRNKDYTIHVDKYLVRKFVKDTIGEQYLIPLLGVWNNADEIDFSALPSSYVLKCNHNSGMGMFINNGKEKVDKKKVKQELNRGLEEDYYLHHREWPYKNVPRKIIAEKYMVDESGYELKDYKIFTFSGKAYCIQVDYDRFVDHHRNFYDLEWNYIPFTTLYPTNQRHIIEKPSCLDELIKCAEKIAEAAGKPSFLRVDFYVIGNSILFGEMTYFHGSGYEQFYPEEYDYKLGSLIDIDKCEIRRNAK